MGQGDFTGIPSLSGITPSFSKVNLATGAAGSAGTGTLAAGVLVVNTTAVTAASVILLTIKVAAGLLGELTVSAQSAGVSFTVTSVIPGGVLTQTSDTSTFNWLVIN